MLSLSAELATVLGQPQETTGPDVRTLSKIAEIRFDHAHNRVDYVEGNHVLRAQLNQRGLLQWLENLVTGARVDLQLGFEENMADLHGKWGQTHKALSTLLDAVSVVEHRDYRHQMLFLHHFWTQAGMLGQKEPRLLASSLLYRTGEQYTRFSRAYNIFKSVGWALAINRDLYGFRFGQEKLVDRLRKHVVLGKTSEKATAWLLSKKMLEPMLRTHSGAIRSALPSMLRGHGFGLLDDMTVGSARARFFAKGYAPGLRSSIAGSIVGIGYDRLRGQDWNSPDMVGHYLDMALTVGWANVPGLQAFAPLVASVRQIGTEVTRKPVEKIGRFVWMLDDFPSMRASELYSIASMTLHGVDPRGRGRVGNLESSR